MTLSTVSTSSTLLFTGATALARNVRSGESCPLAVTEQHLAFIDQRNAGLNCFTAVLHDRALARARAQKRALAAGEDPGPLAGVPFAVKNLFDIEGITTLAGSKINRDLPPAKSDALLIQRLEQAGAILVGALAMGEYAYDFTGENEHYGACRNPWDTDRMSGGSSSGSGTATAAGLVAFALGSDTNGSIRVPASLCGIYGLKPTYGRLPRTGSFPFCDSLDHLGPMARSVSDLALTYDVMQSWDGSDHACVRRPVEPVTSSLRQSLKVLRIVKAAGYFDCRDFPEAEAAVDHVCQALKVSREDEMAGAEQGRAAAYLITNIESATLHKHNINTRPQDFDVDTRDRFLAGALLPGTWYVQAQTARRRWQSAVQKVFAHADIIIAPATPCSAPRLGTRTLMIGGEEQPLRPNLGLFTQPFSAIGLPVCTVPVWLEGATLPIGVQIVAPPWREDLCLRVARYLEQEGVVECRQPGSVLSG